MVSAQCSEQLLREGCNDVMITFALILAIFWQYLSHLLVWSSFSTGEAFAATREGAAGTDGSSCLPSRAQAEQHEGWGNSGDKLQREESQPALATKWAERGFCLCMQGKYGFHIN